MNQEIIQCECGTSIKKCNEARHLNSKNHLKYDLKKQINELKKMIDYHEIRADSWWLFGDNEEGAKAHKKCIKLVQKLCIAKYELKQQYKRL